MILSRKPLAAIFLLAAHAAWGQGSPEAAAPGPSSGAPTAVTAGPVSTVPLADLLAQAQLLARSGRNAEAYELLAAAEDTYIGTIEFDYALGRAALDAGHPDKATLAFARVLALDPAHAGARIDLGRAYLALEDFDRARSTFQSLLARDPPPEIRTQLQAFLDLAEKRGSTAGVSTALQRQGYLAGLVGRSTNINQAPTQTSIFIPLFGSNFDLASQNVKKADNYAGVQGGFDLSQPLNGDYSLIGGGDLLWRRNFHEFDFDLGALNFYVGLAGGSGPNRWKLQVVAGRDYLGRSPSRDLEGIAADYVRQYDAQTQILALVQAGRLRYVPEDLQTNDANYVTLGGGASRKFGGKSTFFGILSTGKQNDVGGSPDGDKRLIGGRVGGEWALADRFLASAVIAGERSTYDMSNTGFNVERRDIRRSYDLGVQYALEPSLFLRFGFSHVDQQSNIAIDESTRSEWSLMLRRDIK
jgi:tetratricopeptide (TPR) repeat protein